MASASTTPVEAQIPKNANKLLLELIGLTGHSLIVQTGADDFSDNNEKPDKVVAKSRGIVYAMIDGPNPDARTGAFTIDFFTKNNGLAEAFLDAINGYNGVWNWSAEGTGAAGTPYVERHCLTMKKTILGARQDGGNMITTYEKVVFEETYAVATDKNTVSVNWFCYGAVTETGPS